MYKLSLFLFRRDLRLEDNRGLEAALEQSKEVLTAFIFDPAQTSEHPYSSSRGFRFMEESLADLAGELKKRHGELESFSGAPEEVVKDIIRSRRINALFLNRDYTPFSRKRDTKLLKVCKHFALPFHIIDDLLLTTPEEVKKKDGTPYSIFTFFHKKALEIPVKQKTVGKKGRFHTAGLSTTGILSPGSGGGRTAGLKKLKKIYLLEKYKEERDIPGLDRTSHLSAHLKFGTLSVREVYREITALWGPFHELNRQLYWRDFFTHIGYHFSRVFRGAFKEKFNALPWPGKQDQFNRWKEGTTGFPVVDAGMRELNETGYMHNRVRMIAASFLVKDLHINWQEGERYFATKLEDYDPSLNNGNWQWCASTGCDAQPWFRIFNPWTQQKKFDPHCEYIKKWIPELKDQSPEIIHNLFRASSPAAYPAPLVNHSIEARITKEIYRDISALSK